jgi:hypothetical protein
VYEKNGNVIIDPFYYLARPLPEKKLTFYDEYDLLTDE